MDYRQYRQLTKAADDEQEEPGMGDAEAELDLDDPGRHLPDYPNIYPEEDLPFPKDVAAWLADQIDFATYDTAATPTMDLLAMLSAPNPKGSNPAKTTIGARDLSKLDPRFALTTLGGMVGGKYIAPWIEQRLRNYAYGKPAAVEPEAAGSWTDYLPGYGWMKRASDRLAQYEREQEEARRRYYGVREAMTYGEYRRPEKGGPGSGHFGHEGRPGQVGGSLPGDGAAPERQPLPPEKEAEVNEVIEEMRTSLKQFGILPDEDLAAFIEQWDKILRKNHSGGERASKEDYDLLDKLYIDGAMKTFGLDPETAYKRLPDGSYVFLAIGDTDEDPINSEDFRELLDAMHGYRKESKRNEEKGWWPF